MYYVVINLCYEISYLNYSDLIEDYVKFKEDCFEFMVYVVSIIII